MTSFFISRAVHYITDETENDNAAWSCSLLSSSTKFTAVAPHVTDLLSFRPNQFACLRQISNNSIRWTKQICLQDFDFCGGRNDGDLSVSFFLDGNYFLNLQDILLYRCTLPSTSQFIFPHLINHPTIDAVFVNCCHGTFRCAFYSAVVGTIGIRVNLKKFCLLSLADICSSDIYGDPHFRKTNAYNSGAIENICQLLTDESKNEHLLVPALEALSAIVHGNPLVTIEDKKRILPGLNVCLTCDDEQVWGAALKNIRFLFGPRSDRDEVLKEVDENYSHWWARFEYLALNKKQEETENVWKVIGVLVDDEDSLSNNIFKSLYGFVESTLQTIANNPASFFFDNTNTTNNHNATTGTDVAGEAFHLLPQLCKKNKLYFRNHPRILKLAMKILLWNDGAFMTKKFRGNLIIDNFWSFIKNLCCGNGAHSIGIMHANYLPVIAHLDVDAQNEIDCYSMSTQEEFGLLLLDKFAKRKFLSPLFELFNQQNSNNNTITATNNNDQPPLHLLTDETAVRTAMSKIKEEAEQQKAEGNSNYDDFFQPLSENTINTKVLNLFMHGQGVAEFLVENNIIEFVLAATSHSGSIVTRFGDILYVEYDRNQRTTEQQEIFIGTHRVDKRTGEIVERSNEEYYKSGDRREREDEADEAKKKNNVTLIQVLGKKSGDVEFAFGRLGLLKRICRLYSIEEEEKLMTVLKSLTAKVASGLLSFCAWIISNLIQQLKEIYRLAKIQNK